MGDVGIFRLFCYVVHRGFVPIFSVVLFFPRIVFVCDTVLLLGLCLYVVFGYLRAIRVLFFAGCIFHGDGVRLVYLFVLGSSNGDSYGDGHR